MKISASFEVIWQLAAQETVVSEFKEIEPDHFFEALLKFSEIPVEQIGKLAPDADLARELSLEVGAVREELEARSIDSRRKRSELRFQLGKGNCPKVEGEMHRSQSSRNAFDAAALLAEKEGNEVIQTRHLLEALLISPTPAMARVLGQAAGERPSKRSKTPLLDDHGRDLTCMAADGELEPVRNRTAECRALLAALGDKDRRAILVVTTREQSAMAVISAAAQAMASGAAPAELKGKRIVVLNGLDGKAPDTELLDKILREASTAPEVILYSSGITPPPTGSPPGSAWSRLQAALGTGTIRCIAKVPPAAHAVLARDAFWKRSARVLWIRDGNPSEIPLEL